MIQLVDLKAQYNSIKDEIDSVVRNCINEASFIRGKAVTEFENAFASYIGVEFCLGCGNGTDALEIILQSLGIGEGDEVLVPALSWIATAESVSNVGAEPVFVDINPNNFTIDITKIEEKITSRTKAIIPVHLYGSPADMDGIMKISRKYNLYIVEDCAQAHGAEYGGKKAGCFGIASAFSFFPSKNLGAFGDAGAIVTNDKTLADKVRMISNHGQLDVKHSHNIIGRNSRLDTFQASVLTVKLKYLDIWNQKRINAAIYFRSKLENISGLCFSPVEEGKKNVYHLFVVRCKNRTKLIELLSKNDISYGIHYPKALPFLEAYKYKEHIPEEFPVSSALTDEIISLPLYPEIKIEHIDFICNLILKNY